MRNIRENFFVGACQLSATYLVVRRFWAVFRPKTRDFGRRLAPVRRSTTRNHHWPEVVGVFAKFNTKWQSSLNRPGDLPPTEHKSLSNAHAREAPLSDLRQVHEASSGRCGYTASLSQYLSTSRCGLQAGNLLRAAVAWSEKSKSTKCVQA